MKTLDSYLVFASVNTTKIVLIKGTNGILVTEVSNLIYYTI